MRRKEQQAPPEGWPEASWHPGGWLEYEATSQELSGLVVRFLEAGRMVVSRLVPPPDQVPPEAQVVVLLPPDAAEELERRFQDAEEARWAGHVRVEVEDQVLEPGRPTAPPLSRWWRAVLGKAPEAAAQDLSRWSGLVVTWGDVQRFRQFLSKYRTGLAVSWKQEQAWRAQKMARQLEGSKRVFMNMLRTLASGGGSQAVLYRSLLAYLEEQTGTRPDRAPVELVRACQRCGELFAPRVATQEYCSRLECRKEARRASWRRMYYRRLEEYREKGRQRARRWYQKHRAR